MDFHHLSTAWAKCAAIAALVTICPPSAETLAAQGLASDPFAAHLLGDWTGSGTYDGNELSLTRTWSLELEGRFLRGEMGVLMPNGASFGSRTYWKPSGDGGYEVAWLDGQGRLQVIQAFRDKASGSLVSEFIDELGEDGPEPGRWEFVTTGPGTYSEKLFSRVGGEWVQVAEWKFTRLRR